MNLNHLIHTRATTLGFDRCGVARCRPLEEHREMLKHWLAQGKHGGLTYMERNLDKRLDPALLVEGARSVIVCAMSYKHPPTTGIASRIASYARGRDYHPVLKAKLHELLTYIRELHPQASGRVFVDTAPILEKSWAVEAGVGRIGRHSLLIVPRLGSFVVLGVIVTDIALDPDPPLRILDPCGSCRACIDACPISAIGDDRTIDASLCIARRTIETETGDEGDLHGWIFGCDTCQLACPHNLHAPESVHACFAPVEAIGLMTETDWIDLSEADFQSLFGDTPLARCGLKHIQRRIRG